MTLALMAWAVITMFVYWAFSGPPLTTWHCSSTLLHFIILNMPKTIDNIRSFLRMTTLWFSIALYGKIRIFAVTGINPSTHTKRSVMLSCLRKPKKLLKVNKICIMALTSMAWAVIIMSVHKGFLRTSASGM